MKNLLLIFTLLVVPTTLNAQDRVNYRPYIATEMAKVIMSGDTPDDEVKELCDGSGWITHGDGHKTECPGCEACQNKTDDKKMEAKDNDWKNCDYLIYHMSAEWCPPCQKMIKEVWKNKEVKDKVKSMNSKIFIYDYDNKDHKKFFEFYGVTSFPTVIVVKPNDLDKPVKKFIGGADKEFVLNMLNKLKEDK